MRVFGGATVIIVGLGLAACVPATILSEPCLATSETETIEFTGRVVYLSFEGGFWGIVSEDNRRYDPGWLADEFRREGLPVSVRARRLPASIGFHMWGEHIEILTIRRIDGQTGVPQ
jgi:hypothetical protein